MAVGGPYGNTKGLALKDPEMRQRAYKSYCDHIAKGKSYKSWYFIEGDCACTYKTMLEYIKDKTEFPPIIKEIAESEGYQQWETIAEESAKGLNKNANTASLQMVMRNKFGWDKDKKEQILSTLSALLKEKEIIQEDVE
jgi:thiamine pyrophosphate-dependent acetolactate synthase large subunit-like protein